MLEWDCANLQFANFFDLFIILTDVLWPINIVSRTTIEALDLADINLFGKLETKNVFRILSENCLR